MNRSHTHGRAAFVLLVAAVLSLLPSAALATELTVDCTGNTPGLLTNLQSAINSLDPIGPHVIRLVNGPCVENVSIIDRQRLTITAAGIGVYIESAAGPGDNVMTISGSTGIHLVQIGFTSGANGLVLDRASEVTIEGSTVGGGNAMSGIVVRENSSLHFTSNLVTGNGGNGITVVDSNIIVEGDSVIENNNGNYGLVLRKSRGVISGWGTGTVIQGNRSGLGVNASALEVYGPALIQNNRTGINVINGGSVALYGDSDNLVTVTANTGVGINTFAGSVLLGDGTRITNNGSSRQPFNAGIRVDDNTTLVTTGGTQISGNFGPGIDVTNGSAVDVSGATISNNSGDGVRLLGGSSIAVFPPNTNIVAGNGGMAVNCDGTSTFLGDRSGLGVITCKYSAINERVASGLKSMLAEPDRPPKRNHP